VARNQSTKDLIFETVRLEELRAKQTEINIQFDAAVIAQADAISRAEEAADTEFGSYVETSNLEDDELDFFHLVELIETGATVDIGYSLGSSEKVK